MPYTTEAVVSGKARIATLTGVSVLVMAESSDWLPKSL